MITPYSKIIGAKILDLKNQVLLGEVAEVVIKKTDLSLHGVILKKSSIDLLGKRKVVSTVDIVEIGNGIVISRSNDSVVDLDETVRIKEAIKDNYYGISQKVYTKSGKRLGKVFDFLVEGPDFRIIKFYVRGIFNERIIPFTSVIKFEGKKIIVKDEFEPNGIGSIAVETEMA